MHRLGLTLILGSQELFKFYFIIHLNWTEKTPQNQKKKKDWESILIDKSSWQAPPIRSLQSFITLAKTEKKKKHWTNSSSQAFIRNKEKSGTSCYLPANSLCYWIINATPSCRKRNSKTKNKIKKYRWLRRKDEIQRTSSMYLIKNLKYWF